jgi:hypothetical protein
MVLVTAAGGLAIAAVALRGGRPGGPVLPATRLRGSMRSAPASRATAVTSARGCSRQRSDLRWSATPTSRAPRNYARAQVLSIRVLRILRASGTAALEVRYWPRGGYSTFVLDRQADGWQAVAIVPGGPLPIA